MCSVHCLYSGFPGCAWYRSWKYSLMWLFASSGFSNLVPSSVIVSYSSFWPLLGILLLNFLNSLRFILLALLNLFMVSVVFSFSSSSMHSLSFFSAHLCIHVMLFLFGCFPSFVLLAGSSTLLSWSV